MDLGKSLRALVAKITRAQVVDEATLKSFIKELQRILIASDVNVKLVLELSKRIEKRASAGEVPKGLTMREHLLKVVYDELVSFMGKSYEPRLDRHKVLLMGLFGSGKTTTAAKVAYFYKKKGLKIGLVGADVERPAAQEQLSQLAAQIGVNYYTVKGEKDAYKVVEDALRRSKDDILIIDSAGRSGFDSRLSEELSNIIRVLKPDESYLVVSGDIGQVAGRQLLTEGFGDHLAAVRLAAGPRANGDARLVGSALGLQLRPQLLQVVGALNPLHSLAHLTNPS